MKVAQSTHTWAFSRSPKLQATDFWRCWQLLVALLWYFFSTNAPAQTNYLRLKSFSGPLVDGRNPFGRLVEGSDGVLYGTTLSGGASDAGTIFKLSKDGGGFTILQNFTGTSGGGDGENPVGGLVQASDGALYGTTMTGGTVNSSGTVFKLDTDGNGYVVLRSFGASTPDAKDLESGLIQGSDGALYGTSVQSTSGFGTVFKLNSNGTGFGVLRSFQFSGVDGKKPYGDLLEGIDGDLYGTTQAGGSADLGTVFKLKKDGTGFTVLRSFSGSAVDGDSPYAGLVQGSDGVLYGTTPYGGSGGVGTVFKINTDGSGFALLRSFTGTVGDGASPYTALIKGSNDTLYGTTRTGGADGIGTVFKLKMDGSGYTVLKSFSSIAGDGEPSSLRQGSDGALYGTTRNGGDSNWGTVFKIYAVAINQPPVVANPISDRTGTYGSTFSSAFSANTFTDPDAGQTLTYTATNLPPGIVFHGATRTLSGTPSATGTFAVTVTATDDGTPPLSTNDVFNLTVVRAPITVTNLADTGAGTLRQAIADAVSGDTIQFAVTGTITLESYLQSLRVDKPLTIAGPGATNLTIQVGNDYSRIFDVTAGPTTISGLTLADGELYNFNIPDAVGGAIRNTADLTLLYCELTNNVSLNQGGAIFNTGSSAKLVAVGCTFAGNVAGPAYVFADSDGTGGAIWSDGVLRVTNCTFSANYSQQFGGAIYSSGDAVIASSTMARSQGGGGIYNGNGILALLNSIVATGNGLDVRGAITSGDYNLIQNTNNLVVQGAHNVLGLDPLLGPLRDNGAPTLSHGLANGSPALDAADAATSPVIDQRGVARPDGAGFDIGAFEGALPLNHPPIVANLIPDQHAIYGDTFNFSVPVTAFGDPDAGQTLIYSSSLRDNVCCLTFNPDTGAINGPLYFVGRMTVTVTAMDDGAPPLSTNTTFDLIVSKRPVTARADDQARPYAQTNPPLSITYYGLVSSPDDLTNPPVATATATLTSPPGNYPVILSDGLDNNYDFFSLTNGTLTVNGVVLEFSQSSGSPNFCWSTNAAAFVLEYTEDLTTAVSWHGVISGITTNGPNLCFPVVPEAAVPLRFYRLHLP